MNNLIITLSLLTAVNMSAFAMASSNDKTADGEIFGPSYIKNNMQKVADWQLSHPLHAPNNWTNGAFYAGVYAAWETTKSPKLYDAMISMGDSINWKPGKRWWHADDIAICQTYLDLYSLEKREEMITATVGTVNRFISEPYQRKNNKDVIKWWWCDALFMGPPTLYKLSALTQDARYIKAADKYFHECHEMLFNKKQHLFARDLDYVSINGETPRKMENNGKLIFWGRGNGWVMGGLVRILKEMPENHCEKSFYVGLYKDMAKRLLSLQQKDGMWRASLLDPGAYPGGEVSGTGFICYALAWGLNNGIIEGKKYESSVKKAWKGLNKCLDSDGKIGWVQPIGASPEKNFSSESWEVYGSGAYLLAGSEVIKMNIK